MRKINAAEKTRLQSTAEQSFNNTLAIPARIETIDDLGGLVVTLTSGSNISAGIKKNLGNEKYFDSGQWFPYDLEIRLPYSTTIQQNDEITVDGNIYLIISPILTGISCIRVLARRMVK